MRQSDTYSTAFALLPSDGSEPKITGVSIADDRCFIMAGDRRIQLDEADAQYFREHHEAGIERIKNVLLRALESITTG